MSIGGYDEGMFPSGYQDIDLFLRLKALCGFAPKYKFDCGESIPNHNAPDSAHHSRDSMLAKMANVAPDIGKTWGQMNTANMQRSKNLLGQKQWWRNIAKGLAAPHDMDAVSSVCRCIGDELTIVMPMVAHQLDDQDRLACTSCVYYAV